VRRVQRDAIACAYSTDGGAAGTLDSPGLGSPLPKIGSPAMVGVDEILDG
jgi:hypothetical protein